MSDSDNNMLAPDDEKLKQLIELAKIVAEDNEFDWDTLNISEAEAYALMASHVVDREMDELTSKATIVKLLVENFVLNLKLEMMNNE